MTYPQRSLPRSTARAGRSASSRSSATAIDPALPARLDALAREFFARPEAEKRAVAMVDGGTAWRGWFPLHGELTSGTPDHKEGYYFGRGAAADGPARAGRHPAPRPECLAGRAGRAPSCAARLPRRARGPRPAPHRGDLGRARRRAAHPRRPVVPRPGDPAAAVPVPAAGPRRRPPRASASTPTTASSPCSGRTPPVGSRCAAATHGWRSRRTRPRSCATSATCSTASPAAGTGPRPTASVRHARRDRISIPFFFDPDWDAVMDGAPAARAAPGRRRRPAVGRHERARLRRHLRRVPARQGREGVPRAPRRGDHRPGRRPTDAAEPSTRASPASSVRLANTARRRSDGGGVRGAADRLRSSARPTPARAPSAAPAWLRPSAARDGPPALDGLHRRRGVGRPRRSGLDGAGLGRGERVAQVVLALASLAELDVDGFDAVPAPVSSSPLMRSISIACRARSAAISSSTTPDPTGRGLRLRPQARERLLGDPPVVGADPLELLDPAAGVGQLAVQDVARLRGRRRARCAAPGRRRAPRPARSGRRRARPAPARPRRRARRAGPARRRARRRCRPGPRRDRRSGAARRRGGAGAAPPPARASRPWPPRRRARRARSRARRAPRPPPPPTPRGRPPPLRPARRARRAGRRATAACSSRRRGRRSGPRAARPRPSTSSAGSAMRASRSSAATCAAASRSSRPRGRPCRLADAVLACGEVVGARTPRVALGERGGREPRPRWYASELARPRVELAGQDPARAIATSSSASRASARATPAELGFEGRGAALSRRPAPRYARSELGRRARRRARRSRPARPGAGRCGRRRPRPRR